MLNKKCCRWTSMAGMFVLYGMLPATMATAQNSTTTSPAFTPKAVQYTPNALKIQAFPNALGIQAAAPVIRVYKDYNAWWDTPREEATLTALGKTLGTDWFNHPVSDCKNGIPAGTSVVLFTSNSNGDISTTAAQNDPACQESLNNFLQGGGTLVVDMGDNDSSGGFIAPGANGTPDLVFPDSGTDATLTSAAIGPDNVIGTDDDHPIVNASVFWNNDNIDLEEGFAWQNHGNLAQGMTLPNGSTLLMTALYQGIEQPILAEYSYNGGRVILDTLTKEFDGQKPSGDGPSNFLLNLLKYALTPECSHDTVLAKLQEAMAVVSTLPLDAFKTKNMQPGFVNQINTAILRVKLGKYAEALHLVRGGILVKTDGCELTGGMDKNDWLKDCANQATVSSLLDEAIKCLESMIQGG